MEERSLRVYDTEKTFFAKVTTTISKLLIPTRVGVNSLIISMKRNNLLKAYENYIEQKDLEEVTKKDLIIKKYEEAYSLYLEAIDKYIMDSVYKKVKSEVASSFEKTALAKYYSITQLKEKEYLEYKYKKQKYLLELDYQTLKEIGKDKIKIRYNSFYVNKMEALYKGILKNYSIKLADNLSSKFESKDNIYEKIFQTLEEYIVDILPIKLSNTKKDEYKEMIDEYEKFEEYTIGKLDEKDLIEKKLILLTISRYLFTHSLPLLVAEQCYIKLLKDTRKLIIETKNSKKKENLYEMLIDLIENYNIKLLSTKVYWTRPEDRDYYKKFWKAYQEILNLKETNFEDYTKKKEILFIKSDLNQLNKTNKYKEIKKEYKLKLVEMGAMRSLKNSCKSIKKHIKKKETAQI